MLSISCRSFHPETGCCYHLRRIIYIATHHMQLPFYDPLLDHPNGAIPSGHRCMTDIRIARFVIGLGDPSPLLIPAGFNDHRHWSSVLRHYSLSDSWSIKLWIILPWEFSRTFCGLTTSSEIYQCRNLLSIIAWLCCYSVIILYKTFTAYQAGIRIYQGCGLLSVLVALLFWVYAGFIPALWSISPDSTVLRMAEQTIPVT